MVNKSDIIKMLITLGHKYTVYNNERFGNSIFVDDITYRCIFRFSDSGTLLQIEI